MEGDFYMHANSPFNYCQASKRRMKVTYNLPIDKGNIPDKAY